MTQQELDLTAPKVIWRVQIGRYSKGAYENKYSMESAAQAKGITTASTSARDSRSAY